MSWDKVCTAFGCMATATERNAQELPVCQAHLEFEQLDPEELADACMDVRDILWPANGTRALPDVLAMDAIRKRLDFLRPRDRV